jgi:hypothetical protein
VDLAIVAAALPLCVVALALALVVWGLRKRIVCDHEDDYGTTALSEPVS